MEIKRAYKELPLGFSDGVTRTENGTISDLYYIGAYGNSFIGRIGKWEDGFFTGPAFTATPTGYSPFKNRARTFSTRKEAAIYLLGVHDSQQNWMKNHKKFPVPGTTHIPLSLD